MSKQKTIYTCSFCGHQEPKWVGRCPDCEQWNTFYEELQVKPARAIHAGARATDSKPVPITDVATDSEQRRSTGIAELDRVLGGGLVRGAVVLIGGDPGIGKSTLVLQAMSRLAEQGTGVLYVSGEESLRQVRMRAERLGNLSERLTVLAETSLEQIQTHLEACRPEVLVIDSVQTVHTAAVESAPGSVSQIRESSGALIQFAKRTDTAMFLIGHVTKEGAIAGPRVLEHMVDTVLYFEGDRGHAFRILRAVKNRFGSTDEIGVFEMRADGLAEIASPSELFISERPDQAPGSAVVPSLEGTRPILVEIQALTSPSNLSMPRRTAIGIDHNRISVLVAVLEKRLGFTLYNNDIFINIAGGIRVQEPGVDLGIVAAVVSSRLNRPLPPKTALCGEVGLAGEVRAVSQMAVRVKEAGRLGFTRCLVPEKNLAQIPNTGAASLIGVGSIDAAIEHLFDTRRPRAGRKQ